MLNSRYVKRVAVTGGLASGKSSACRLFGELGAYVVSCDAIVHHLLEESSKLTKQVVDLLGDEVLVKGRLDRTLIAKRVFADSSLALQLEKLLHPLVRQQLEKAYQDCVEAATYPLFVAEVPLLYEVGWESDFDFVIAVICDPEECKKRFRSAFFFDSPSELDCAYEQRMARQMDPKEKADLADCVLTNQTDVQNLRRAVQELYCSLTKGASSENCGR